MTLEHDFRRQEAKRGIVSEFEQTLEDRVNRYLAVQHAGIVANHHFAAASSECIDLYRDGHFLSAVMVSQAVAEGIWKLVLERNQQPASEDRPSVTPGLVAAGILSQNVADAFVRIWRSFRNDVHHMNPKVATIPFAELAHRNVVDLGAIERELFAWTITEPGKITPTQARYWDLQPDGTAPVSCEIRGRDRRLRRSRIAVKRCHESCALFVRHARPLEVEKKRDFNFFGSPCNNSLRYCALQIEARFNASRSGLMAWQPSGHFFSDHQS